MIINQFTVGLIVSAIVITGSVVTTKSNNNDSSSKFATTYYALNPNGETYRKVGPVNPDEDCETELSFESCVISYPDDNHDNQLTVGMLPSGYTEESGPGYIPIEE